MKKIIVVIALASLLGGCGVALAHGAGDEPMYEKLGIAEPSMLPDSSFYFLKEWGRGIKMFFTFNPVKKADLSLRITDEKIAELDKLIDDKPDEKETLQHALDNYLEAQDDLAKRLEKLQGKNKNVDSLLEKLADRVVEHQALFGQLEKRTGEESVKSAKQKIGKTADDALLLDKEKFKEKLEKKLKKEDEEIEIDDFLEDLEIELEDLSDDLNELEENDGKKATSTQKTKKDKDGEEMNKNKGRDKEINFCAEIYLPVCGKNGKTYSNECFAKAAGVEIKHNGACQTAINDCSNVPVPDQPAPPQGCAYKPPLHCENNKWITGSLVCEEPPKEPQQSSSQEFKIEADDSGFYPSNTIAVTKGMKTKIIFTVRTTNVYYAGLDFQSSKFPTTSAKPGNSVAVEFVAAESFTINSYWPKTFAFKASLKVEVR